MLEIPRQSPRVFWKFGYFQTKYKLKALTVKVLRHRRCLGRIRHFQNDLSVAEHFFSTEFTFMNIHDLQYSRWRGRLFLYLFHDEGLNHIGTSPLICIAMDRFLYDRDLRHERVNSPLPLPPASQTYRHWPGDNDRELTPVITSTQTLQIKITERHQWFCSGVFIVNSDHVSQIFPVFLLSNLNR